MGLAAMLQWIEWPQSFRTGRVRIPLSGSCNVLILFLPPYRHRNHLQAVRPSMPSASLAFPRSPSLLAACGRDNPGRHLSTGILGIPDFQRLELGLSLGFNRVCARALAPASPLDHAP
jgi:hypothetical protein